MSSFMPTSFNPFGCSSRRHFLAANGFRLSALGLAWLLKQDGAFADDPIKPDLEPRHFDLLPKPPKFKPRATAMISICSIPNPC
jgi:hypothetical protein